MALLHQVSCNFFMAAFLLLLIGLFHITGVKSIGICYGKNGNNIPSETDVVNLCKRNGIKGIRVYDVNSQILNALRGSNMDVIVDVPNEKLQEITDPARANNWVQTYIIPYTNNVNFKTVVVGREVYAGNQGTARYVNFVLPALRNVHGALSAAGLQDRIKVSTATYSDLLQNTYPPSNSEFKADAKDFIIPIVQFLADNDSPLLANIYPYFGRVNSPGVIPLSFALFTSTTTNGAGYQNFFDALYDCMYAAVQKVLPPPAVQAERGRRHSLPPIIASESGWPSGGGPPDATPNNAATYYTNLMQHVNSNRGTPMRPGGPIETYLFAMFDENMKPGNGDEKNFGLFNPNNQNQKYNLNFH